MSIQSFLQIRKALGTLNPKHVREMARRPVRIALHASTPDSYERMERFFLRDLSPVRRRDSALMITRAPIGPGQHIDISVFDEATPATHDALVFHPGRPNALAYKTLARYPDFGIALARAFPPFRKPFVERVIAATARENTLFSITTALPDVIPSFIELPWALAEFASDTAFLTANQVRMAFQIAAASDREVGYAEQKSEIAMVIGSAFGWRALARQLVGKIPFGGGLIAKAAVAYAGTKVLGLSLDHLYSIGFTYSREERDRLYADAFQHGKKVAVKVLSHLRPDMAAKYLQRRAPAPTQPGASMQLLE